MQTAVAADDVVPVPVVEVGVTDDVDTAGGDISGSRLIGSPPML